MTTVWGTKWIRNANGLMCEWLNWIMESENMRFLLLIKRLAAIFVQSKQVYEQWIICMITCIDGMIGNEYLVFFQKIHFNTTMSNIVFKTLPKPEL